MFHPMFHSVLIFDELSRFIYSDGTLDIHLMKHLKFSPEDPSKRRTRCSSDGTSDVVLMKHLKFVHGLMKHPVGIPELPKRTSSSMWPPKKQLIVWNIRSLETR